MYKKTKEVTFCPQWSPMKQSTNTLVTLVAQTPRCCTDCLPSSSSMLWQDRFVTSSGGSLSPNKAGYSVSHVSISQCFPTFEKKIEDNAHERDIVSCVQSVYGVYVRVYTDRDL